MAKVVGLEYTVIGWCRNKEVLGDEFTLKKLLNDICKVAGMRALASTCVNAPAEIGRLKLDRFEDEGGASASLILSTSHINVHGWPCRDPDRVDGGFFWFTLGSCRSFQLALVDEILNSYLKVTHTTRHVREMIEP